MNGIEIFKWGIENKDEFDQIYGLHEEKIGGMSLFTTFTHFWRADDGPLAPVKLGLWPKVSNRNYSRAPHDLSETSDIGRVDGGFSRRIFGEVGG